MFGIASPSSFNKDGGDGSPQHGEKMGLVAGRQGNRDAPKSTLRAILLIAHYGVRIVMNLGTQGNKVFLFHCQPHHWLGW